MVLTSESRQYERKIYNTIDLLGDLGGVIEIIMVAFGFIFYPISQHSFVIEATKRLFLANTSDDSLFELEKIDDKKQAKILDTSKFPDNKRHTYCKHRHISISMHDSCCLFCSNKLGWLFPSCCWQNHDKLSKLYRTSEDRIETELDIIKVMRNIRMQRILLKSKLMDR